MNLLLDTHIVLWWQQNNPKLGEAARDLIADATNAIFVSSISLWEMAIKTALGKLELDFAEVTQALTDDGFNILDFGVEHAWTVLALPMHHQDPFDRALVAQCKAQAMVLVTHDAQLSVYGSFVKRV